MTMSACQSRIRRATAWRFSSDGMSSPSWTSMTADSMPRIRAHSATSAFGGLSQRTAGALEVSDVAVRHRHELHLVPLRRPQRRHSTRLELGVVWMRPERDDPERFCWRLQAIAGERPARSRPGNDIITSQCIRFMSRTREWRRRRVAVGRGVNGRVCANGRAQMEAGLESSEPGESSADADQLTIRERPGSRPSVRCDGTSRHCCSCRRSSTTSTGRR